MNREDIDISIHIAFFDTYLLSLVHLDLSRHLIFPYIEADCHSIVALE